MTKPLRYFVLFSLPYLALCSCRTSNRLTVSSVAYQSVHTEHQQPEKVPDDAKIAVFYSITPSGDLVVLVKNMTSEIMTIDQTMSFLVNSDGQSISYYDPTVRTQTITDISQNTEGASVNLGSIAGALGVGGPIGTLLNGITIGEANTTGQSVSNTTYFSDQPRVSLGPKGTGKMSKNFSVKGLGVAQLTKTKGIGLNWTKDSSPCQFSVCISYSLDGGNNFDKIITKFYVNSELSFPVRNGEQVNAALRQVLTTKPDALNESLWLLDIDNNISDTAGALCNGVLVDYQ